MKTFFVSSTFKDMQYERDAIHEITLPKLNAIAQQYGQTVSFCDLRWGVNTLDLDKEEGMRKVMKVCLDEIDRCKPPLVVILGDCYGTIVTPEELVKATAEYKNFTLENYELSATAIEVIYGALIEKNKNNRTLFYFRDIENAPSEYLAEDSFHKEKLVELKEAIVKNAVNPVHHYSVKWENNELVGVNEFAEQLVQDLFELMRPEWEAFFSLTSFEREREIQWNHIKDKASVFSGRDELLNKYIEQVNKGEKLIFIKGETGSGKSALFSAAAIKLQSIGWDVLPFVGGLTTESNDALDIIHNTVYYLENKLGLKHYAEEKNTDGKELIGHTLEEWQGRLAELCYEYEKAGNKLIIMLDAVDQLFADSVRDNLRFIPENLSENIRFFITANESFSTVGVKFSMLKKLDGNEVQSVVEGILSRYNRQLDKYVIENILHKQEGKNPLYLSLLVQRLLMMDKDDFFAIRESGKGMKSISEYQCEIIDSCPSDLESLFAAIIDEVSKRIGSSAVNLAMQYIAASRFGLRQDDLANLLPKNQWNPLAFAHFISYLNDCFVKRDDGRFDFSHISIRRGILNHCDDLEMINRNLFEHFRSLDVNDPVRKSEILFHAIKSDQCEFFIEYIGENYLGDAVEAKEGCLTDATKCVYDTVRQDSGNWICNAIRKAPLEKNTISFVKFINTSLMSLMLNYQSDIEIGVKILKEICDLTELLIKNNVHGGIIANVTSKILTVQFKSLTDFKGKIAFTEKTVKEVIQKIEELVKTEKTEESLKVLQYCYLSSHELYLSIGDREHTLLAIDFAKKAFTLVEDNEYATYGKLSSKSVRNIILVNAYLSLNDASYWEDVEALLNESRSLIVDGDVNTQLSLCFMFGLYYYAKGGLDNINLALAEYEKAVNIAHTAYSRQGNIDLLIWEIRCRNNLIKGLIDSAMKNNLNRALEVSLENIKIATQLSEDLGTAVILDLLSLITMNLAQIYQNIGGEEAFSKSLECFYKAIQISRELAEKIDTPNSKFALAMKQITIAQNMLTVTPNSKHDEIICFIQETMSLVERVREEFPGYLQSETYFASAHNLMGLVFANDKEYRKALSEFDIATNILEKIMKETGLPEVEHLLSAIYNNYGLVYSAIKMENTSFFEMLETFYKNELDNNELEDLLVEAISQSKGEVIILRELFDTQDEGNADYEESMDVSKNDKSEEEQFEFDADDMQEDQFDLHKTLAYISDWTKKMNVLEAEIKDFKKDSINKIKEAPAQEALCYYKKALDIAEQYAERLQTLEAYAVLSQCYGNVGVTYLTMEKYEDAISYIQKAIFYAEKNVNRMDTFSARINLYRLKSYLLGAYTSLPNYQEKAEKLVLETINGLELLKKEWNVESLDLTFLDAYNCAIELYRKNPYLFEKSQVRNIYNNLIQIYNQNYKISGLVNIMHVMILADYISYLEENEPYRKEEYLHVILELLSLLRKMEEKPKEILQMQFMNLNKALEEYNNKEMQDSQEYLDLLLEELEVLDQMSGDGDEDEDDEDDYDDEDDEDYYYDDEEEDDADEFLWLRYESMIAGYDALTHPLLPEDKVDELMFDVYLKANLLKDIPEYGGPAQDIYDEIREILSSTEAGQVFLKYVDDIQ